jgi:hypothetical protein
MVDQEHQLQVIMEAAVAEVLLLQVKLQVPHQPLVVVEMVVVEQQIQLQEVL